MSDEFERVKKRIEDYVVDVCTSFCMENCSGRCCDLGRYKLCFDSSSIGLFTENGLDIVDLEGCVLNSGEDASVLAQKLVEKGSRAFMVDTVGFRKDCEPLELRLRNGTLVRDPSMIKVVSGKGEIYVAYSPSRFYKCPLYSEEGECMVHDDPRRPEGCRVFPLFIVQSSPEEGYIGSCGFNPGLAEDCPLLGEDWFISGVEGLSEGRLYLAWKD